MNQYYILEPSSNDLYHHGILGQKWGKRQGPPYPLSGSAHSSSEKKAGWKKSLDGGSSRAERKQAKREAKAEKYRTNELSTLRTEQRKIENKLAKARNPKSNSSLRKQERLDQISKEIETVSNMSMEDISKEKKKVAINAFYNALAMGGVAGISTAMGNPMFLLMIPNDKGVKTRNRLGKEQLKQMRKDTWDSQENIKRLESDLKKNNIKDEEIKSMLNLELNEAKKSNLSNEMERARKNDSYNIDFLEAIQNTKMLHDGNKKEMLTEYEKYLKDPSDYWKNRQYLLEEV